MKIFNNKNLSESISPVFFAFETGVLGMKRIPGFFRALSTIEFQIETGSCQVQVGDKIRVDDSLSYFSAIGEVVEKTQKPHTTLITASIADSAGGATEILKFTKASTGDTLGDNAVSYTRIIDKLIHPDYPEIEEIGRKILNAVSRRK